MRNELTEKGYNEVITKPIIKEMCYFEEWDKEVETPVSGLIEYHDSELNWIASIDFGNGDCDQWATKRWNSVILTIIRGRRDFLFLKLSQKIQKITIVF